MPVDGQAAIGARIHVADGTGMTKLGSCVIGFNHGVLGLAENPARGTGFWSQNTEGVARGVLTEKARPKGQFLLIPI